MSKSKKELPGFMPLPSMWGWFGDLDEYKEKWEDFKSTVDSFWDQMIEMQKTSMEAWKEQWNKAFPQFMEMQDNLIASLPEELPTPPGMPAIKPKKVMEKVKEFQETANKHAVEQADTRIDFVMQSQQQAKEAVKDAVERIEEKIEEKTEEKVEKKAEKKAAEKQEKPADGNAEKPAANDKPKTAKAKSGNKGGARNPRRKQPAKAIAAESADTVKNAETNPADTADAAAKEPGNE